jgi:hypothetical protein
MSPTLTLSVGIWNPYDVVSVCSALITISEGKNNIGVAEDESSDQ